MENDKDIVRSEILAIFGQFFEVIHSDLDNFDIGGYILKSGMYRMNLQISLRKEQFNVIFLTATFFRLIHEGGTFTTLDFPSICTNTDVKMNPPLRLSDLILLKRCTKQFAKLCYAAILGSVATMGIE